MPRPLIGITTYLEAARWGTWVREAAISPQGYARAVLKAGGVPVLVPPISPSSCRDYLHGLDGVVLAGGIGVDPSLYGESPDDRVEAPSRSATASRSSWPRPRWRPTSRSSRSRA